MNDKQIPDINPQELQQKPIAQAETIPSGWYRNKEVYEFEKEALFSSFWQLACHGSENITLRSDLRSMVRNLYGS